jgi:hypothetical protein
VSKSICKPPSVISQCETDDHLSGTWIAPRLMQSTRREAGRLIAPARPCSRWGLPSREHCCPRWWSLTPPFHPRTNANLFAPMQYTSLWHSAVGSPRLAFRQHRTLWRADFPHLGLLAEARSPGQLGHPFIIVLEHLFFKAQPFHRHIFKRRLMFDDGGGRILSKSAAMSP